MKVVSCQGQRTYTEAYPGKCEGRNVVFDLSKTVEMVTGISNTRDEPQWGIFYLDDSRCFCCIPSARYDKQYDVFNALVWTRNICGLAYDSAHPMNSSV